MLKRLRGLSLAAALSVCAAAMPATAEARDDYRDRDDDAAIAIGAGIIGLALGAAIASDRDDRYYYRDRSYYPAHPGYYYDRYPRRHYRDYRRDRWYGDDRGYREHRRWHKKHNRWHRKHDRWRH